MSTTTEKKVYDNILEAIGHTPMVRINRITKGIIPATVLAKIETFNPGNSIKDRMAVRMIEDAERKGLLKPGGTIIEGTSGNTGMGLAIAAVVKGYRCIFTTTDKQSKEKIDALKAFGAEVIVCPTNVDPEDPRSYYSVSSRLEQEVPNSWKANQYDNLSNTAAHYEQTGPEIWEQTDGRVTHLVVGVGTGGTISGVGRYLKERNPRSRSGASTRTARSSRSTRRPASSTRTRSIPTSPRASARTSCRRTSTSTSSTLREGDRQGRRDDDAPHRPRRGDLRRQLRRVGDGRPAAAHAISSRATTSSSSSSTITARAISAKMFNDDWMREKGFFDRSGLTARDLVASGVSGELLAIEGTEPVENAVKLMGERDFSQISITRDKRLVGSLNETHLYEQLVAFARRQEPAGRDDHAAGVSVRRHLDAGRTAVDDDHPGEPGGARARLQDRQDLHHHQVGRDSRALLIVPPVRTTSAGCKSRGL